MKTEVRRLLLQMFILILHSKVCMCCLAVIFAVIAVTLYITVITATVLSQNLLLGTGLTWSNGPPKQKWSVSCIQNKIGEWL